MNDNDHSGVLSVMDTWDTSFAACAVLRGDEIVATRGDPTSVVRIASVTKLLTAWTALLAIEEGAVRLDDAAGPVGSTVAHLLCHASGLDFDSERVLAPPGTRRIYSNSGYEALAAHVASSTGMAFDDYLSEGVLEPLGMGASELRGSPAADLWSCVDDLITFVGELRGPTLLAGTTAAMARMVQFPDLAGVLPGWGRQDPCQWGYGPELKGTKEPHWTGSTASAATYGHFGGSGTFVWIDPHVDVSCVTLTDREFGPWAVAAWPDFSDAVRTGYAESSSV